MWAGEGKVEPRNNTHHVIVAVPCVGEGGLDIFSCGAGDLWLNDEAASLAVVVRRGF